jgi:hypothetical protein
MRTIQLPGLQAELTGALGELLVSDFTVESHHARRILLEFLRQQDASLGIILPFQLFDASRRALHQIGESDAKLDQALVILVIDQFGYDAGFVKKRPELIAPASVVMPDTRGTVTRIAAHQNELHSPPEIVWKSPHCAAPIPNLCTELDQCHELTTWKGLGAALPRRIVRQFPTAGDSEDADLRELLGKTSEPKNVGVASNCI